MITDFSRFSSPIKYEAIMKYNAIGDFLAKRDLKQQHNAMVQYDRGGQSTPPPLPLNQYAAFMKPKNNILSIGDIRMVLTIFRNVFSFIYII